MKGAIRGIIIDYFLAGVVSGVLAILLLGAPWVTTLHPTIRACVALVPFLCWWSGFALEERKVRLEYFVFAGLGLLTIWSTYRFLAKIVTA